MGTGLQAGIACCVHHHYAPCTEMRVHHLLASGGTGLTMSVEPQGTFFYTSVDISTEISTQKYCLSPQNHLRAAS